MLRSILVCISLFSMGMLWAQERMIPHVTRNGGGFITTVILENQDIAPASYLLVPYNTAGGRLEPVTGTVDPLAVVSLEKNILFADREGVAWFTVESVTDLRVTIAYGNETGSGSPAHVTETAVQATRYRLFAGNWGQVFDGIAVVNRGDVTDDVWVTQRGADHSVIQTEKALTLPPNAKGLFVIGGPEEGRFQQVNGSFFEVHATQPLAITALRGSLPGSEYLWVNPVEVYKPAVVKVTNDNPGNSECVDPTTLPGHAADVNNMPQGEVWIDVSPNGRLAACAKDYRYSPVEDSLYNLRVWDGLYLSEDGGSGWRNLMFSDSDPNRGLVGLTGEGYGQEPGREVFLGHQSDPVVGFDRDGNLYTCALGFQSDHNPNASIGDDPTALIVARRDPDGKLVRETLQYIGMEQDPSLFNDKNWMAVDRSEPVTSTVVAVTWRLFTFGEEPSMPPGGYLAVSGDGAKSFSQPIQLPIPTNRSANSQFYQPLIGPDPETGRKTLYILFRTPGQEQFSILMHLIKADIEGIEGTTALHNYLTNAGNWNFLDSRVQGLFGYGSGGYQGAFRFSSIFMPAIHQTNGYLYATAEVFNPLTQGAVVVITHSIDGGQTWSIPQPVDDPGTGMQLMPAVAVAGDRVSVVWYDSRNDSTFAPFSLIRKIDVFYAELSLDLQVDRVLRLTPKTQTADHPVFVRPLPSDAKRDGKGEQPHDRHPYISGSPGMPSPLIPIPYKMDVTPCDGYGFIGDYIGLAADERFAYAVWADLRELETSQTICAGGDCKGRRNQNVYFARIRK